MWIYLNDRFVAEEDARISVFDHGFLYGDGVYETLRSYAGRFFLLAQHIKRLYRSADMIDLTIPLAEQDWARVLGEALQRNGLARGATGGSAEPADGHVRITISRGKGELGLDPELCPHPTVVIMTKPLSPTPARLFEQGVRLVLVSVRRNSAATLPPQIKSLNFLNNILAKREASRAGAFDALMLNQEGVVTECTVSNVFFARHGRLHTPSVACGILEGVTRGVVIQLAAESGIAVEEGAFPPAALLEADECFITNTSMEIMPVSEVDGKKIGKGAPGAVTAQLRDSFRRNLSRFLT